MAPVSSGWVAPVSRSIVRRSRSNSAGRASVMVRIFNCRRDSSALSVIESGGLGQRGEQAGPGGSTNRPPISRSASYRWCPEWAVPGPTVRRGEDLLDDHPRPRTERRAQPGQVAARVGQPVGMIDPNSVDEPLGEPSGNLGMRRVEDRRILLAQAGQRGDREEAPVAAPRCASRPGGSAGGRARHGRRRPGSRARRDRKPHPVEGQVIAVDGESLQVLGASEHRQHVALRVGGEVDVEEGRVVRVPAVPQNVPPPGLFAEGRPRRGWARCRRPDPGPAFCRAGQPCETVWPTQFGRDGRRSVTSYPCEEPAAAVSTGER